MKTEQLPKKRKKVQFDDRLQKRRYRRPSSSDDDEDGSESGLYSWKTALAVAALAICFASLWPKLFQPFLLATLGWSKEPGGQRQSSGQGRPNFPVPGHGMPMPHGRPLDPSMGSGGGKNEDYRRGMPHHPHFGGGHPGMQTTGNTRRGGVSFLLPIYSVGVIVFLLYMFAKIFFKSDGSSSHNRGRNRTLHYDSRNGRGRFLAPETDSSECSSGEEYDQRNKRLSAKKLHSLQDRLVNTEQALQKILEQLGSLAVSEEVNTELVQSVKNVTNETLENIRKDVEEMKDESQALTDSTPLDDEVEEVPLTDKSPSDESDDVPMRHSGNPEGYLQDLERALMDFQKFTEDYVSKQKDHLNDPHENGTNESEMVFAANGELSSEGRSEPWEQSSEDTDSSQ